MPSAVASEIDSPRQSLTHATTSAITASGPWLASVDLLWEVRILPSASTRAVRTFVPPRSTPSVGPRLSSPVTRLIGVPDGGRKPMSPCCLLYTSDAADDLTRVDLG